MALTQEQYAQLKIDDAAGHPSTGAFNANPKIAVGEWNAENRDADADFAGILGYMFTERNRTQQGSDNIQTPILGRLLDYARADVGADPFVRGTAAGQVKLVEKHAAMAFEHVLIQAAAGVPIKTTNTEFTAWLEELVGNGNAGVLKPADRDAIIAFTQNKRSYAAERGYGALTVGDIEIARALP